MTTTLKDVGTWGGKGAEILEKLKGDVQRKDFVALANNKRPGANGKRLTARMNKTRLEDVIDKTGMPTIDSADRDGEEARSLQPAGVLVQTLEKGRCRAIMAADDGPHFGAGSLQGSAF